MSGVITGQKTKKGEIWVKQVKIVEEMEEESRGESRVKWGSFKRSVGEGKELHGKIISTLCRPHSS